jgi:hypothetical protein
MMRKAASESNWHVSICRENNKSFIVVSSVTPQFELHFYFDLHPEEIEELLKTIKKQGSIQGCSDELTEEQICNFWTEAFKVRLGVVFDEFMNFVKKIESYLKNMLKLKDNKLICRWLLSCNEDSEDEKNS